LAEIGTLDHDFENAARPPLVEEVTFLPTIGSEVPEAKDKPTVAADESQYHGPYLSLQVGGPTIGRAYQLELIRS